MAKARSTTTGASVRARAAAKPRSARATARPVSKSAVKPHKRHRLLGFLATMFALLALAGAAARALPADLQELPFAPIVVSATPWFTLLGLIALLLAIVSRRILAALIAIAAIVLLLDRSTPPSRAERRGRSLPQHQRCLRARHDLQCV